MEETFVLGLEQVGEPGEEGCRSGEEYVQSSWGKKTRGLKYRK